MRFLWWLVRSQMGRVLAGATFGTLWMVGLAVVPYLIARAIDDGMRHGHSAALVLWVAALLGMTIVNAVMGAARHRAMTRVRMAASFQMVRAIVKQETRLGAALARRASSGEVVAVGVADVQTIAQSLTVTGPGIGAVVAYIVVAILLLSISRALALVILAGVPLLAFAIGPLLRPLERLSSGYREQQGALTGALVDMMTGLRVLSGLGGKEAFLDRYRRGSDALREKGYEVGVVTSWVGALAFGPAGDLPRRRDLAVGADGGHPHDLHRRPHRGHRLRRDAGRSGRVLYRGRYGHHARSDQRPPHDRLSQPPRGSRRRR